MIFILISLYFFFKSFKKNKNINQFSGLLFVLINLIPKNYLPFLRIPCNSQEFLWVPRNSQEFACRSLTVHLKGWRGTITTTIITTTTTGSFHRAPPRRPFPTCNPLCSRGCKLRRPTHIKCCEHVSTKSNKKRPTTCTQTLLRRDL